MVNVWVEDCHITRVSAIPTDCSPSAGFRQIPEQDMPRKTRRYIPGHTHKVSRSTLEHTFFLAPVPGSREAFGYALAHAANKYGIEIHTAVAMASHYHITATDPFGKFGLFLSTLNSLLTRMFNVRIGRCDTLWGSGRPSVQRILRPIDHIAQARYVICNPVKAGLVASASQWPGFIITPGQIGQTLTFERPDSPFFETRAEREMPQTIELRIHEPKDAIEQMGPGGFAQGVAEAVALREAELFIKHKGSFLGPDKVARTNPLDKSANGPPASKPDIEIVCGDPDLLVQELAELADFRIRYRLARERMPEANVPCSLTAHTPCAYSTASRSRRDLPTRIGSLQLSERQPVTLVLFPPQRPAS
jgi:putative transposase